MVGVYPICNRVYGWRVVSDYIAPVVLSLEELELLLDAVQGLWVGELQGLGGSRGCSCRRRR